MSTEFYNRNWRMPNSWNGSNDNNNKVSNYSMSFNGNDQYISVGNPAELQFNGSFSISCWVKVDNSSNNAVISKDSNVGNGAGYHIDFRDGNAVHAWAYNASNKVIANGLSTNVWYNIVFVFESTGGSNGNQSLYINAEKTSTNTINNFQASTVRDLRIGGSEVLSNHFGGNIDHVAIFDYALSDGGVSVGQTAGGQISDLYGNSTNGVGNPMSLNPKPKAYYPIGDYAAFNGSEYLVNNGALQDYNVSLNPTNSITNQSIGLNQAYSYPNGFTISFWFKQRTATSQTFYDNRSTDESQKVLVWGNATYVGFNVNNRGVSSKTPPNVSMSANANKWTHVACVYNPNATFVSNRQAADFGTIYVNGVSKDSSSWTYGLPRMLVYGASTSGAISPALNLTTQNARIGQSALNLIGPYEMLGQLSNFAIFDTAMPGLGAQSVDSLYNNGTPPDLSTYNNLQGWWPLNASSTYSSSTGNWTFPDFSSNSNDGTSTTNMNQSNLVQSDLNITTPYSRFALSFDGSDYIDCTNASTLNFERTDSFSASVWANFNLNGTRQIIGKQLNSGTYTGWAIQQLTNYKIRAILIHNLVNRIMLETPANSFSLTGGWYHIAFTYDGSSSANGVKIYINGSSASLSSTGEDNVTSSIQSNANFSIGARNNIDINFNGELSNPSVWSSTLTPSQVTELYNQGKPGNLNNHSAYSNLVSWWQLGENMSFVGGDPQGAGGTEWIVLDEKGSNNGTGSNLGPAENAIVNGVGTTANGLSDGMGGADNIIGDAPYSTANAASYGMDVEARVSGSGNVPT